LELYSGEFDIEWGADMVYGDEETYWHTNQQNEFRKWLCKHNLDPFDPKLSNGHLPIGKINLLESFGTEDQFAIWDILSSYLDVYAIEIDNRKKVYNYCWTDQNYKNMQINLLKPGYDYSSGRR
jgi:hypothetical protein